MTPMRLWIGLVFLALGGFGILDATGTLESSETIDRWWPVAIIGLGVIPMLVQRRVTLGLSVVAVVGILLLANQQEWTDEDLVGPAILTLIGLVVLFAGIERSRRAGASAERRGESAVIFGGTKINDRSEHLTHRDVSAIFGGATLDLREAHIDKEASVDAFAMFGGVDIVVPHGWRVQLGGLPIFGGYEDKTTGNGSLPEDAPKLKVNATAVFGGVDVVNEPKK